MRWARVPQALGAVAPATELAPEQALASLPPWTKSETAPHLICIRPSGKMLPRQMKRATIHFDGGGQSPGPVTAACTVELSDGSFDQDVERFDHGTHNTAEWQALILGLGMALKLGERHVVAKGDSMLVVKQINREWKTKDAALQALRAHAEELLALFETWRVEWIPRKENQRTDELGRAQCAPGPVRVLAASADLDEEHKATEYVRSGISRQRRATASGALKESPMTASTKNVFLLSGGSPEFRFPRRVDDRLGCPWHPRRRHAHQQVVVQRAPASSSQRRHRRLGRYEVGQGHGRFRDHRRPGRGRLAPARPGEVALDSAATPARAA
jgi:ribonuclease HI